MIRLVVERCYPPRSVDALVQIVFQGKDGRPLLQGVRALAGGDIIPEAGTGFAAREKETILLFPKNLAAPRILLVGAGSDGAWSAERLRRSAAIAARVLRGAGVRSAAFMEPGAAMLGPLGDDPAETYGTALAEGIFLGLYRFDRYRTVTVTPPDLLARIVILAGGEPNERAMRRGVSYARTVCEATCLARDLANAPPNALYPGTLAEAARAAGRRSGFSVSVHDERKIRALGMGGLLGVGGGSARPPRLIVMRYGGRKRRRGAPRPVVLVGKGVTFDSGGISIKPSAGMAEMKMDMAGGATVIGVMQAAAALRLPGPLVGIVPAAENLPGPSAFRPGDILRHANGMTSEVDNTDAEGRLMLADALAFAATFRPSLVIDLATLTGAVVVALAHVTTGMLGTGEEAMRALEESGRRVYERVWELPMFEEYEALIRSDVADVKNTGGRWGGAIAAAMFLKKFAGGTPWVHLDIAGTAILEEGGDYTVKGGSGVGVRLLVDFLRRRRA